VPWHGLGEVLKKHPKSIDEALKKSGLDWDIIQRPIYVELPGAEGGEVSMVEDGAGDPKFLANMRSDTGDVLGIVTDRYTPVQNREAFSFLANLFGTEMLFETAGSLMEGRRVWVMMKLPDYVEVGGDPIGQYAFISNSHDGKSSVLCSLTPIRIVCMNTLGAAIRLAKGKNATRSYTIRHLGNMSNKIAEARNVLEVTINYYEQFKEVGDRLALAPMSEQRAKNILGELFPIDDSMKERAARNKEEAREAVMSLFLTGQGPVQRVSQGDTRPQNALGTAWAFYNACTEYADYGREERKVGGTFQRAIDDPDGLKTAAWNLTLDTVGEKKGTKNKSLVGAI
jgi:phage/plasmid-like protein (TIGR03299 family)